MKSKPFRVLHLFPRFRPNFAGDGIYFEKLWPKLVEQGGGHDVVVFTTPAPAQLPSVAPPGMKLIYLRRSERETQRRVLLRYYLWLVRNLRSYSVIHSRTHIDRFFISHFIARLFGIAIIYSATLDDSPPYILWTYRPSRWRFVTWAMKTTLTRLVAISPRLRDDSVAFLGPERVVLIPQGVALPPPASQSREELRAAHGIPPDSFVLLYVGSVSRRKDVMFLVENLAELRLKRRPYLIVLGPKLEEDYCKEVSMRIAELGLGGQVRFEDYHDDLAPFYRLADVFVFASWIEGFGNVLIEAMSFGLPIVARRLEGVTDFVILDGKTGILFDTKEQYRDALTRLESEPELGAGLARNAYLKAATDYSLDSTVRRYIALYREVSGEES